MFCANTKKACSVPHLQLTEIMPRYGGTNTTAQLWLGQGFLQIQLLLLIN